MAGIYVHIPFCKQACIYCDFHFSTSTRRRGEMVEAIAREAEMRQNYLGGERIDTLYFGGGTPSLLSEKELSDLINHFQRHFSFSEKLEFTFEANPDDLTPSKISSLKSLGVNRLSIGLQALDDGILRWMNRAHSAQEGLNAIRASQAEGINNLSIDLIYGRPGLKLGEWKMEIDRILDLGVPHVSAYCLTVEPRTVLGKRVEKKLEKPIDEQAAAAQFELLIDTLAEAGLEQYEVSNFAKAGFYSRHNTAYWQGTPYLGLGPSAHSFDGNQRAWNLANNPGYMQRIKSETLPLTIETAGQYDRLNEWIMTGLRTKWGLDLAYAKTKWNADFEAKYGVTIAQLLNDGLAEFDGRSLRLTRRGLFQADGIAAGFFWVEGMN